MRRAIVLLQANYLGAGKILLEAQDVADFGSAPAIDGLVLIANGAQVASLARQPIQQLVLDAVGVLVFVHQDVAETVGPLGARVVKSLQDVEGAQQ